MVLKRRPFLRFSLGEFENDVEMYGAQTLPSSSTIALLFENDVEMYGAQTRAKKRTRRKRFENDVEMYGAQTKKGVSVSGICLRMM